MQNNAKLVIQCKMQFTELFVIVNEFNLSTYEGYFIAAPIKKKTGTLLNVETVYDEDSNCIKTCPNFHTKLFKCTRRYRTTIRITILVLDNSLSIRYKQILSEIFPVTSSHFHLFCVVFGWVFWSFVCHMRNS